MKKRKSGLIITAVLAVALIASVVINIVFAVKNSRLNLAYSDLSDNYESIGREMLEAKNDARNKGLEIDKLNDTVAKLEKAVSDYSSALSMASQNIYLSENHYLAGKSVNIWNVVGGDEIRVDSSMYYAFYTKTVNVDISFFSPNGLIETKTYEAGKNYFITMPSNCELITRENYESDIYLLSTGVPVDSNEIPDNKFFYVVAQDAPYELSISDAVSKLEECGTVFVMPGEYVENILTRDKEVNILGADRDSCVIISYDNDYYNPVLEISAGTVSNITLKAVDDGRGLGSDLKAYAVHADFDYMYGRNLTFQNCVLHSDFNAGAGIGLRGESTLSFIDCDITGYYHGLFLHDSKEADVGGNQNLIAEGCTFTGLNGDVALVLSSCLTEGGNVNVKFINNTLANVYSPESANLFAAVNEDLKDYEGYYMELKNFHLDEASSGNNVDAMNY